MMQQVKRVYLLLFPPPPLTQECKAAEAGARPGPARYQSTCVEASLHNTNTPMT
jgi:hypothetical protein